MGEVVMIPVGIQFTVVEEREFRDPATKQTIANYLPRMGYRVTAKNQAFVSALFVEGVGKLYIPNSPLRLGEATGTIEV